MEFHGLYKESLEKPTNWDSACSHILNNANAKVFVGHGMDSCSGTTQNFHQIPADAKK